MEVIFSEHANKQRVLRKIPKKYVLETIESPQKKIRSFRGRELLQRGFNGKILEVVTYKEGNIVTIVTQYYLERKL